MWETATVCSSRYYKISIDASKTVKKWDTKQLNFRIFNPPNSYSIFLNRSKPGENYEFSPQSADCWHGFFERYNTYTVSVSPGFWSNTNNPWDTFLDPHTHWKNKKCSFWMYFLQAKLYRLVFLSRKLQKNFGWYLGQPQKWWDCKVQNRLACDFHCDFRPWYTKWTLSRDKRWSSNG